MPKVGLDCVFDELESSDEVTVMPVLVRSSLFHGADNRLALLILTDQTLLFGGSEAMGGMFQRVCLKSVTSYSKVGKLVWECVMVKHMDLEGEKTLYICPFTGSPSAPKKDQESMELLLGRLRMG